MHICPNFTRRRIISFFESPYNYFKICRYIVMHEKSLVFAKVFRKVLHNFAKEKNLFDNIWAVLEQKCDKLQLPLLKGTVSRDFRLLAFSWISFPQAPEYTSRAVSNFFENLRRYSQLKVHHQCHWHRWKMEKIFNHKSFNYFVGSPLESRVNL